MGAWQDMGWVDTADALPAAGRLIFGAGWLEAGYRFGTIWLMPRPDGPLYVKPPVRWRYA